jgi:hypothetical protein
MGLPSPVRGEQVLHFKVRAARVAFNPCLASWPDMVYMVSN